MGRYQQLAAELPAADGAAGIVLSASKELEPGTRSMVLLAEGLFRLDVVVGDDTFRTILRNLSSVEIEALGEGSGYGQPSFVVGDAPVYRPAKFDSEFALGSGEDRVEVRIVIATLRFAERGAARVSAQAIIRHAPLS